MLGYDRDRGWRAEDGVRPWPPMLGYVRGCRAEDGVRPRSPMLGYTADWCVAATHVDATHHVDGRGWKDRRWVMERQTMGRRKYRRIVLGIK
eukprot:scaffold188698_cov36-Attheya_sp.AAC.1